MATQCLPARASNIVCIVSYFVWLLNACQHVLATRFVNAVLFYDTFSYYSVKIYNGHYLYLQLMYFIAMVRIEFDVG